MSLLGKRFSLEDVDDVERLCRSLLRDISDHLQWWQYDDCLMDLIGRAWEIHAGWDPERTASFRQYLTYKIAKYELPNLARHYRGRSKWQFSEYTYERERPALLSLHAGNGDGRLLGESVGLRSSLPPPDRAADVRAGIVRSRHSQRAGDKRRLSAALSKTLAA